ncbi:MAG: NERD domain-containing protein [Bacillus sp. (in: Bacteria)]|nr:NERD domain-containing protein [Bacillus sp. (in: firmicutes)]
MILLPRSLPLHMKIRQILLYRDSLTEKDKRYFNSQYKGYLGECLFDDEWLPKIPDDWLVLNDLKLEYNNTSFQIDSLIITTNNLYIYDIKHFDKDYYYNSNDEKIYYVGYKENGKDSLRQLRRCEDLLRSLLIQLRYPEFTVVGYLAFVNPEFYLYELPTGLPMILPTQKYKFIETLKKQPVNITQRHRALANDLISRRITKGPFDTLPEYSRGEVKNGICCEKCGSFMGRKNDYFVECENCGIKEKIDKAVLRSIEEFILLFPEMKITTKAIVEWCVVIPKRTISRILNANFKRVGSKRNAYYLPK